MGSRTTIAAALAGLLVCLAANAAGEDDAAALAGIIDRHIQAGLDGAGLSRAPQAEDAEFLR